MDDIVRVYSNELDLIDEPYSSVCEACRNPMPGHRWADLDANGFAVRCSNSD